MGIMCLNKKVNRLSSERKLQQWLCKQIRGYAQGDKNCFLKTASMPDLQRILKQLMMERERYTKEHASDERLLAMLKASMVV